MKDNSRPGLRARTVAQLALDLALAKDPGDALADKPEDAGKAGRLDETGRGRGRAIFLIGAGCSQSAGIKLAREVAQECVLFLRARYPSANGNEPPTENPGKALDALIKEGKIPRKYGGPEHDWDGLYPYLFAQHIKSPNVQRPIIANIVSEENHRLNWAHVCLGHLVERRYIHTVLTTNFDQLILKGIERTGILPVVADGLEALIRIDPSPTSPQIVHLHGSMHTYDLRNSTEALNKTADDQTYQSMMMSLLRQSKILVVVGYAGGEEGVMRLLQFAAKRIPGLVIYWVTYSSDYDRLSPRAKKLLKEGENKFFVLEQDADAFFHTLIRELRIGQPEWITKPIPTLESQAAELQPTLGKQPSNRSSKKLADAFLERVRKIRPTKSDLLAEANQAVLIGDLAAAHKYLGTDPNRPEVRRLQAEVYQQEYNADPEGSGDKIDNAIKLLSKLAQSGNSDDSFYDLTSLIEAKFNLYEHSNEYELKSERGKSSDLLNEIVNLALTGMKRKNIKDDVERKLELSYYKSRALQESSEKPDPGGSGGSVAIRRKTVESYDETIKLLDQQVLARNRESRRAREIRDGWAQSVVAYAQAVIEAVDAASGLDRDAKLALESNRSVDILTRALELHRNQIRFSRRNLDDEACAGTYSNAAEAYNTAARLSAILGTMPNTLPDPVRARRLAVKGLRFAIDIYRANNMTVKVAAAERRLLEFEAQAS